MVRADGPPPRPAARRLCCVCFFPPLSRRSFLPVRPAAAARAGASGPRERAAGAAALCRGASPGVSPLPSADLATWARAVAPEGVTQRVSPRGSRIRRSCLGRGRGRARARGWSPRPYPVLRRRGRAFVSFCRLDARLDVSIASQRARSSLPRADLGPSRAPSPYLIVPASSPLALPAHASVSGSLRRPTSGRAPSPRRSRSSTAACTPRPSRSARSAPWPSSRRTRTTPARTERSPFDPPERRARGHQ